MFTRTSIERQARASNECHARLNEAFESYRAKPSDAARQKWKDAATAFHNCENTAFYLWPTEARHQMRRGEREAVEDALIFLEVDPWFFRSGYLKERVTRHLKSARLSEDDAQRLRDVVFAVACGRNRREFRDYCRLALRVWTPVWEEFLRQQLQTRGAASGGGKLFYLLQFLDAHRDKLI